MTWQCFYCDFFVIFCVLLKSYVFAITIQVLAHMLFYKIDVIYACDFVGGGGAWHICAHVHVLCVV